MLRMEIDPRLFGPKANALMLLHFILWMRKLNFRERLRNLFKGIRV